MVEKLDSGKQVCKLYGGESKNYPISEIESFYRIQVQNNDEHAVTMIFTVDICAICFEDDDVVSRDEIKNKKILELNDHCLFVDIVSIEMLRCR